MKITREGGMAIRYIPEDLVVNILARLPVESLMRLRCVDKSWYALIRSPSFIAKHITQTTSCEISQCSIIFNRRRRDRCPMVSLLSNKTLEVYIDVHIPLFDQHTATILIYGPCNGILCLYGPCRTHGNGGLLGDDIALWNPATREYKVLPLSSPLRQPDSDDMFPELGFGFDPKTNEYKVVRITVFVKEQLSESSVIYVKEQVVEVYTLSTNSWRKVDTNFQIHIDCSNTTLQAYANGYCYWWAKGDGGAVILSFDMTNEVFHKIQPPQDISKLSLVPSSPSGTLVELNGSIVLFTMIWRSDKDIVLHLWVMEEKGDNKAWIKQPNIALWDEVSDVLGFWVSGGEVLVKDFDSNLALYDPSTQKLKSLNLYGGLQIVFCPKSLVSVKGGIQQELNDLDNLGEMAGDPIFISK